LAGSSDLIAELTAQKAVTVALQAPEGLKRKLSEIAADLRESGFSVIISGDPCYGACDLDLEILNHADVLVHLGHAPVDRTGRVIYDIARMDFRPESVSSAIPLLTEREIGLVTTVQHAHMIQKVTAFLRDAGIEAIVAPGSVRTPYDGQILGCSFDAARKTGAREILYVGTGMFHPLGIQIATRSRVIACDPYTRTSVVVDGERLLRKRFALIERARDAERFGIIISPKSGQYRRDLATRLVSLSDRAVPVLLREVTPDQLLNLGMPCYVNTACPRLAYDDQVRWPVPVLTPCEFEILCGKRGFESYEVDEIR
jgi:2-(3-amino-3-carboxypropyl)histidine synthase